MSAAADMDWGNSDNPTLLRLSDTDWTIDEGEEDIRTRKVIGADGEALGKVDDLLVDDGIRQVRFLVVSHGGILGIGAKESFIPAEAVTEVSAGQVTVDTDVQAVAGAPQYDPALGPEPRFYENTYGYYGITPYWSASPHAGGWRQEMHADR